MRSDPRLTLYLKVTSLLDVMHRHRLFGRDPAPSDAGRDHEYLGQPAGVRPQGTLIWINGPSMDAVSAMRGMVPRLETALGEDVTPLLTTPTTPPPPPIEDAIHQLAPRDTTPAAERFLDHWRPDIAVFVGDCVTPALVHCTRQRRVPLIWVNATWDRSNLHWRPWFTSSLLSDFACIFPSTDADRLALHHMAVPQDSVGNTGDLQEDGVVLPCDEVERDRIAYALQSRPVWLSAPVTLDDLPALDTAHRMVTRQSHRLLLIVVPQSPAIEPELARLFEGLGWSVRRRAAGELPLPETQVYLADSEKEMGLWYRLAPITFISRTLESPGGGGNPFEPAALGSVVLHGPFVGRHRQRFDRLSRHDASILVHSGSELGQAVDRLMAPDQAAKTAEAAWRVTSESAEVTDRVLNALVDALDAHRGDTS